MNMENLLNNPFFTWTGIVFWGVVAVAIIGFICLSIYAFAALYLRDMYGWNGIKIIFAGWWMVATNEHITMGNYTANEMKFLKSHMDHGERVLPVPISKLLKKNLKRQQRERKAAGLNYIQL